MMMPLVLVVGVSMIKDIFEDRKRHRSDNEENQRRTKILPKGESQMRDDRAKNIKVGTIVKVMENEFFPCDLLLLNSSI